MDISILSQHTPLLKTRTSINEVTKLLKRTSRLYFLWGQKLRIKNQVRDPVTLRNRELS
jgi:hypothetical protein